MNAYCKYFCNLFVTLSDDKEMLRAGLRCRPWPGAPVFSGGPLLSKVQK